ncbi:hypothetical protein EV421DRAFT_2088582 [Armillaria borealis]|uniref:Heterokaryon incompatibility domain-containing protein n=1 Tax=Armillaria borealis TaxID=47425 RepID=A0AA39J1F6_9AGAR|nr:hypothetical protein EV421DRAFT_2088582 [Armillaria borealis]
MSDWDDDEVNDSDDDEVDTWDEMDLWDAVGVWDEVNDSDDDEESDSDTDDEEVTQPANEQEGDQHPEVTVSAFTETDQDGEELITYYKPLPLPEVTISAFTETGIAEPSIIVPLQRAYTGRYPVISSRLADTPSATLGVQGLSDQLNTMLGTSYTLDNQFLSSLLEDFITIDYDFGLIYGCLRGMWYINDWSTLQDVLGRRRDKDWEERRDALIGNRIVNPNLRPRHVWDLCSNRVVPLWTMVNERKYHMRSPWPQPISHAWVDEKDRAVVWTPINGYQWPVPIPKDADLNLIRIEMLNLGLEYAWLDVLCLRQVGGPEEDLRIEEWKVDVPTIGAVYQNGGDVVCYLSGLGRPLRLKEGDLESDRCWFRRAWTLQEYGSRRTIAGDTPDGQLHVKLTDGTLETGLLLNFKRPQQSMSFFGVLKEMQRRVSTNPVDKIAGLAYLMHCKTIPAYYESQSLEEAWTALVNSMDELYRGCLFSLCPEPGNAGKKWRPSWDQVMMKPPPANDLLLSNIEVDRDETRDEDLANYADCIEGLVRGLAVVEEKSPSLASWGTIRLGELIVKDKDGIEHGFEIIATHTYPIPEDTYTLIDARSDVFCPSYGWIVGRSLPGGKFEKVSVLEISKTEHDRLEDLCIDEEHAYNLI